MLRGALGGISGRLPRVLSCGLDDWCQCNIDANGNASSTVSLSVSVSGGRASLVRMSAAELVYVAVVLRIGREIRVAPAQAATEAPPRDSALGGWAQLGKVDLQEELLNRVPMLKSCPHFLRGRMRECFAVALRERDRAKSAGDVLCQTRAWKLLCLDPKMLLCRPRNSGSLGRNELVQRIVKF